MCQVTWNSLRWQAWRSSNVGISDGRTKEPFWRSWWWSARFMSATRRRGGLSSSTQCEVFEEPFQTSSRFAAAMVGAVASCFTSRTGMIFWTSLTTVAAARTVQRATRLWPGLPCLAILLLVRWRAHHDLGCRWFPLSAHLLQYIPVGDHVFSFIFHTHLSKLYFQNSQYI